MTAIEHVTNYLNKMNKFYSTRLNSIHHGHIRLDILKGELYSQELYIHDHLKKPKMPPKPATVDYVAKIIEIVNENKEEFNKTRNGFLVFFIRNWVIYKYGIHTTSMENGKGDTYE